MKALRRLAGSELALHMGRVFGMTLFFVLAVWLVLGTFVL